MSDISRDIGNIWSRQFDHKQFLIGEINFTLQEFEVKRGDTEVDYLFKAIENITDIKDTEIDKFKQAIDNTLPEANTELQRALNICNRFADIKNEYKEGVPLETSREKRNSDWKNFIDNITSSYSEINSLFEKKEEDLTKTYTELEKQLLTPKV